MAGLARRLVEAEAALATLDEAVAKAPSSLMKWDGAIPRLIYTFEAVWKACREALAERGDIEVASPNTAIRAARRLGWLSDDDAEAAMKLAVTAIWRFICIAASLARRSGDALRVTPRCCAAGLRPCGRGRATATDA